MKRTITFEVAIDIEQYNEQLTANLVAEAVQAAVEHRLYPLQGKDAPAYVYTDIRISLVDDLHAKCLREPEAYETQRLEEKE